ncbi:MAG TPA: signal peptidase I [Candidatus Limnocylindrales bacterium]|nr:signal peptidase I [Candidatus Limnocylindrales bacterium]
MAKSQPRRVRAKQGESLRDWIKTLVLVLAVVITFRGVVAQAYQIPTGSMERTLLIGDYLYINKMLYGSEIDIGFHGHRFFYHRFPAFRQPRPGDVIVFRYPPNPQQDFIKRCVAVGGQTVEVRDKVLFVDGKPKNEPYAVHDDSRVFPREISARDNFGPFLVPKGDLFMMGDNRDNSLDSRFWGPLPEGMVKGKAMFTYFSWDPRAHMVRFGRMFRAIV